MSAAFESCQRRRSAFLGVASVVLRVVSSIVVSVVPGPVDGASTGVAIATDGARSVSVSSRLSGIGSLSDFAARLGSNPSPVAA